MRMRVDKHGAGLWDNSIVFEKAVRLGLDTSTARLYGACMIPPNPWDAGYKPPTPAEIFSESAPLSESVVRGLVHDYAVSDQAARYDELLDALEEALKEPVPRAYARIVRLVREARA
jgi:hypothetical protein